MSTNTATLVCAICGTEWESLFDRASLYCPECRWVTLPCLHCGTTFRQQRSRATVRRYCTIECQHAHQSGQRKKVRPVEVKPPVRLIPLGLLSYDEAAAALSEHYGWIVTIGQVWSLVSDGTLEAARHGDRVLIVADSVDRYLGRRPIGKVA